MSDANPPVVRCGGCGELLAEPTDLAPDQRRPCSTCGSTARAFEAGAMAARVVISAHVAGFVTESADVTVHPPAAVARAGADPPEVKITEGVPDEIARANESIEASKLREAGFSVSWWELSEGGPAMVRVFKGDEYADGSIADDPQDAILAVIESLIPDWKKPS